MTKRTGRTIAVTGVALLALCLLAAGSVGTLRALGMAHGSGIEREVRGVGTASGVTCARNYLAFGHGWWCRAERIDWTTREDVSSRVRVQRAPYQILATSDLSGTEVQVTSHLPTNWQIAGGRSARPEEIILADGHPTDPDSGSWSAVVAFGPLVVVGVPVLLLVLVCLRHDLGSSGRWLRRGPWGRGPRPRAGRRTKHHQKR